MIIGLALLLNSFGTFARRSQIREVNTNDHLMKVVNLTMGRSTVISFQDKPVKVISGNSNYFNVEFVGNDLTLQPLAPVETNLFVYTEKGVKFGFLLKVGSASNYDDILYVKWKSQNAIKMSTLKPQKVLKSFTLKVDGLEIKVRKFFRLNEFKSYVFDFEVINKKKNQIKTDHIQIFLGQSNRRFTRQTLVWEKDTIASKQTSKGRVLALLEQSQNFLFNVHVNGKKARRTITKDYL